MSDVQKVLKEANKKYQTQIMTKGSAVQLRKRIPFGSLSLDVETGGGIPVGMITTISGEYSDGKTSVVLKAVANFQRLYPEKDVVWIDAEGSWDRKWAHSLGVDVDRVYLVHPEYSQQAFDIAEQCISADVGLLVVDSVAALVPKEEAEATMEDWQVGLAARINNKFIRRTHSSLNDKRDSDVPPTVILINQLRESVGPYGGQTEPGGKGIGFAAAVRIKVKKGDLYPTRKSNYDDKGPDPCAQQIKFYVEKNKTAPPKTNGYVWFYFKTLDEYRPQGSYDVLEEVVRYVKKYNVLNTRGAWFDLPDPETGEVIALNGANALVEHLREHPTHKQWVEKQVMEVVQKTYAKTEQKLDEHADDNEGPGSSSGEEAKRESSTSERSDSVGKRGRKEQEVPVSTQADGPEESLGDLLSLDEPTT